MSQLDETTTPACPNSVLGKSFSILSAFDDGSPSLRLVDLSARTGIPKPSVHRLAQELVALDMLARTPSGYRLGDALVGLGQRVSTASALRAAARPVLVDLCASTRAPIHLSVRDGLTVRYLEKLAGSRSHHVLAPRDGGFPLLGTASGRLLLAHAPDRVDVLAQVRRDAAARGGDPLHGMEAELATIRHQRYNREVGTVTAGFKTFAVAIEDSAGNCMAGLCATVPIVHRSDKELIAHLWSAAAQISRRHAVRSHSSESGVVDGQQTQHRSQRNEGLLRTS